MFIEAAYRLSGVDRHAVRGLEEPLHIVIYNPVTCGISLNEKCFTIPQLILVHSSAIEDTYLESIIERGNNKQNEIAFIITGMHQTYDPYVNMSWFVLQT